MTTIKSMKPILNHVNATILKQVRLRLDEDLETSDLKRRKRIKYYWEAGVSQAKIAKLQIVKFSPHTDEYTWFMAGYYDAIYFGHRYSTTEHPILWGIEE